MKILYFLDTFSHPWAGTEGQIIRLIEGMQAAGHHVEVVLLRNSEYLKTNVFPCPYKCLDIYSVKNPLAWVRLFSLSKYIRSNEFNVVHTFFNDSSFVAPFVCKLASVPVIVSRRDMGFWHNKVKMILLKLLQPIITAYAVNSSAVKDVTVEKEGAKPEKVAVIYNGLELEAPISIDRPDQEVFNICLVANYRPLKRICDLIEAFAILRRSLDRPARLFLVGAGIEEALAPLAIRLGVDKDIDFVGQHDSPQDIIAMCDVAVLCSESEGLSNSLIECHLLAKPIVCTRVGGNEEIVDDGKTGFLIDLYDCNALAECLLKLALDPDLMRRFGVAGRELVLSRFEVATMLEKYQKVYLKLVLS